MMGRVADGEWKGHEIELPSCGRGVISFMDLECGIEWDVFGGGVVADRYPPFLYLYQSLFTEKV